MKAAFQLRLATEEDIPALHALIEASVRGCRLMTTRRRRLKALWEVCWGWIRS